MPQPCLDPLDQFFTTLSATRPPARGRRIVIADDNQDMADSLRMLLEQDGHKVLATRDGAGAIELARTVQPDFLLLDIGMPKLNGYDVARHIRTQPWGGRLCLVAITGWGQPEDRSRAIKAGFDYHLTKPVPLDELGDILNARGAYALRIQRKQTQ
jgi:CheY-like chemotaxis protein